MNGRRHNDPQSPHERARVLASDRLDGPLSADDRIWLEGHLSDCDACRAVAGAYAEDRALLRMLPMPEPPRDLWARTSVALERERAGRSGRSSDRVGRRVGWQVLSGIFAVLIVGLLVARTLLPGSGSDIGLATPGPGGSGPSVGATPLAVPPGNVAWITHSIDGGYTMNVANVAQVCPQDASPSSDCATIDAGAKRVVSFLKKPGSVVLDPQARQAAVVESSASSTGGSIFVVPISRPSATPSAPTASPSTSAAPPATSTPGASPSGEPSASGRPTSSPPSPSGEPSKSAQPSSEPSVGPTGSPVPTGTPAPTATNALAIIDDVVVVGGDAAYSPDGQWLAFSARPAQGSDGPDVYVWHSGDPKAHAATTDHGSVFSAWVDDQILASRADRPVVVEDAPGSLDPLATPAQPLSFLLDPASGEEHDLGGLAAWRPVVDPSGRWFVYWTGSLVFDPIARTWIPADGRLLIDRWDSTGDDPSASADPQALLPAGAAPTRDWEIRWDPSGRYLGAWVADPLSPGLGRLSLLAVDRADGRIDLDRKPVLRDQPALPGFAIGDGRIAWATPPGQNGEGSRLLVLAWKGPDAGRVRSDPANSQDDIIVVR
jgi:hypothetical protein